MKLHHATGIVLVAIGLAVAGVAYASSSSGSQVLHAGSKGLRLTAGSYLVAVKATLTNNSSSVQSETCSVAATTYPGHAAFVDGFSSGTFEVGPNPTSSPHSSYAPASFSGLLKIEPGEKTRTYLTCGPPAPIDVQWWAVRLSG